MLERKRSLLRCLATNLSRKLDVSAGGCRFSDPSPKTKNVRSLFRSIHGSAWPNLRKISILRLASPCDTMRSWPLLKYFSLLRVFPCQIHVRGWRRSFSYNPEEDQIRGKLPKSAGGYIYIRGGGGGVGPNPFPRHWVELAHEWKQRWCVTIRHR